MSDLIHDPDDPHYSTCEEGWSYHDRDDEEEEEEDDNEVEGNEAEEEIKKVLANESPLVDVVKKLSRLIEIAAMLNYEFKWEFKRAA